MRSREICLWMDERLYAALSHQLGSKTVEDRLNDYLEELLLLIPEEQRRQIGGEIQKEQEEYDRMMEEHQQFSIFHVRENGRDDYFQIDSATYTANTAYHVRQYLRGEPGWQADIFSEGYSHREPISADEYDRLLALHLESPQKIVSVFDLDFDKQEFSVAVPEKSWRSYAMKDISTAAYHAYRNSYSLMEKREERLWDHLDGKQIASAGHLSAKEISLADEIVETDGCLNFYLETVFDTDSVFGTHVLGASDRWLNIYADYEMATGSVCDALSLRIYYEDGREESLEYRLNAIEKATLLRKMDAYCLQQTGQSLKDYSAGLMAEKEIAPPAGPAL